MSATQGRTVKDVAFRKMSAKGQALLVERHKAKAMELFSRLYDIYLQDFVAEEEEFDASITKELADKFEDTTAQHFLSYAVESASNLVSWNREEREAEGNCDDACQKIKDMIDDLYDLEVTDEMMIDYQLLTHENKN